MSLKPSVVGGKRLRDMAKTLRDAGDKQLPRNLQKAVKTAGQPALKDLKASALAIKVTGYDSLATRRFKGTSAPKQLRQRIADATSIEYSATARGARVRFHTDPAKMGTAGVLPRYLDLGDKFRHPIMGRRSRWADESGEPWFFEPIKNSLPEFRNDIDKAIDDTIDQIEAS